MIMIYQRTTLKISSAVLLACSLASTVFAHPIISGLESTKISPELQGRVLIEELNCAACHKSEAPFAARSKKAPRLADIGSRVNPSYLKTFISDPHGTKPGTTMPDVLVGMDEKQKDEVAESITHFLLSLKKNNFAPKVPDHVSATKGEHLFHSRGCVACHSPRGAEGNETMAEKSAPLGDLTNKYSHTSLVKFLRNPHAVRPSGRMPKLEIPGNEIDSIAEYLLRDTKLPGNLKYTFYRGSISEGLDSDGIVPERAGHTEDFDPTRMGTKIRGQYAVEYDGWINITHPGNHTFYLKMNGGSLSIDGKEIIDVKPSQMREPQTYEETVKIEAGWKKVKLIYYHTGRKPMMAVEMKGPQFKKGPIPSSLLSVSDKPVADFKPLKFIPELAARGREHFGALGCASCHDDLGVKQNDHAPFSKLTGGKGCLSKPSTLIKSKSKHPHFNLSAEQGELISASLQKAATKELSNIENVHKTLVTFNCTACHEREGVGAVSPERLNVKLGEMNKNLVGFKDKTGIFTGTHPELGDQGKIPPTLSHVGAKLKPEWIHKVLIEGVRQRPYMNVVMPHYGAENIGHLSELFGKVDSLETVKFPEIENIKESKNAGYNMIGPKGFSCVACHNYNGLSSGAGAIDLVNVNKSLQKNWFHLFMQNPSRFHSTGIMPSFWPGGQSIRPDVLSGKPDQQIEALWAYLADGPRAKKPEGLSRRTKDVRVFDKAEIVRGRSEVGYRGIGVGYPERLNLAFDGDEMALRLLWKGDFASIDFGSFKVSGDNKIAFPPGVPFHRLESMDANWPYKSKTNYLFPQNLGYQFRGYRLDETRRPTFQYEYGDIKVDDIFEDVTEETKGAKFKRTFTFDTPTAQKPFYFRAGVGELIKAKTDKVYQIDKLQISITSDHKGLIREGNPGDLLISIELPKGKSTLTLEYTW